MTTASRLEQSVGMACFATTGPPCAGRAKGEAEDFVVEELLRDLKLSQTETPGGLPLYRVEKRSVDTLHMASELAHALKSRVSYAGLKDRRAVAVQYVTPTSRRSERPEMVAMKGFTARRIGFVDRPLSRSALVGNRFALVLRGCCPQIGSRLEEALGLAEKRRIPNFYGLQRFGTAGGGSHRIGRAIVGGDFEGAVAAMLLSEPGIPSAAAASEAFRAGRYEEGSRLLPPGKDAERRVARELGRRPGEWIRALRSLPVRLRRLYVHAYQSYIFNRTLSRAVAEGEDISVLKNGDNWASTSEGGLVVLEPRGVKDSPSSTAIPLVQMAGYAYRDYGGRFDKLVNAILLEEGVKPGQFYVKDMQEVSSEGGFRRPHLALGEARWEADRGDARLWFTLGKGEYATVLLREVLKPEDPVAAGLA